MTTRQMPAGYCFCFGARLNKRGQPHYWRLISNDIRIDSQYQCPPYTKRLPITAWKLLLSVNSSVKVIKRSAKVNSSQSRQAIKLSKISSAVLKFGVDMSSNFEDFP